MSSEADQLSSQCSSCGQQVQIGEWPFCPHGWPSGHHHMPTYEVDIDGQIHTISSLQDANRIERESMARYRNGEGQPLVFRAFHQDNSNRDKHTLPGWSQQVNPRTQRGVPIRSGSTRLKE